MISVYKDILDDFFGMKLENSINDAMMEFSYKFPYEGMKEYSLEICNIPFSVFLEYINKYQDNNDISADCVSQFSKLEDCLLGFCEATDNMRRPLTFEEIGERLQDDGVNRNSVANTKYGENHAKVALQFGLAQCRYNYWYISALGKVFSQLSQTKRDALMIRTLLRNKLYALIFTRLQTQDVSIESIWKKVNISESTRTRRLSSVKRILTWYFGVLYQEKFTYQHKIIEVPLSNIQYNKLPVNYQRRILVEFPKNHDELKHFSLLSASEKEFYTYSDLYIEQILRIPYLSKEDEKKYFEQYLAGDERARDAIVEAYLPTLYNIARRYIAHYPTMDIQDLIGEGVYALCKAIPYYVPSSPSRLITFAIHGIRGAMYEYVLNNRLVRLPVNQSVSLKKILTACERFEQANERRPSAEELSLILNEPVDKIADALKMSGNIVSLEGYEDLICAENEDSPLYKLDRESLIKEINHALATLPVREADILRKLFGIETKEKTLEEIGIEFHLTRERVRQISEKAIRHLKASSRSRILKTYLGSNAFYNIETNIEKNNDSVEQTNKKVNNVEQTLPNATDDTIVEITDGPFCGFKGKVIKILPDKKSLLVLVQVSNRKSPIELRFSQIIVKNQTLNDQIKEIVNAQARKKVATSSSVVVKRKVEKIKYKINYKTDEVSIVKYNGIETEDVISPTVNLSNREYRVTSIANHAFSSAKQIELIKLPDTITIIDERSFQDCANLKEIELPNSLKLIEDFAFFNCQSLASIKIPNNVEKIGSNAFRACSSLHTILLPQNIRSIETYTFYGCSTLKSIEIPQYVDKIDFYAFSNCTSLRDITLPQRLTLIGARAFENCTSLIEILIPNNVRTINKYAFANCTSLERVILPSTLTKIGEDIFKDCSSLKEILIPYGKKEYYKKIGLLKYIDLLKEGQWSNINFNKLQHEQIEFPTKEKVLQAQNMNICYEEKFSCTLCLRYITCLTVPYNTKHKWHLCPDCYKKLISEN